MASTYPLCCPHLRLLASTVFLLLQVWEKYVEPVVVDGEDGAVGATNGHASRERMDVIVTEIADGGSFWAQKADEPRVAWLQEQMRLVSGTDIGPRVRRCSARFLRNDVLD